MLSPSLRQDLAVEAFQDLVLDFAHFLEDWQQRLAKLEQEVPWPPRPGAENADQRALIDLIRNDFVVTCVRFNRQIDASRRRCEPEEDEELRLFSIRHLQNLLLTTPWIRQATHKPLGYPGDFEVMRYMYEDQWAGSTHFARAMGYAIHQTPSARAVPARKDMLLEQLRGKLAEHPPGRALRLLSVAAGPAQETFELLSEPSLSSPIDAVLFEQEEKALDYAKSRLEPLIGPETPQRGAAEGSRIHYLQESIRRLLVEPSFLDPFGDFDVILCAGLFDYLRPHTARRLISSLVSRLSPRGTFYFGNMVPETESRWISEHQMDWWLLYRSRSTLISLAEQAAPGASFTLLEEASGINPFIAVTREGSSRAATPG